MRLKMNLNLPRDLVRQNTFFLSLSLSPFLFTPSLPPFFSPLLFSPRSFPPSLAPPPSPLHPPAPHPQLTQPRRDGLRRKNDLLMRMP